MKSKSEIWLRVNPRPLWLSLLGMVAMFAALALIDFWFMPSTWNGWFAAPVAAVGLVGILAVWIVRRPILAYRPGELLVNLRAGKPHVVPIEIVEGFLLGRQELDYGPTRRAQAKALTIKLADKASDWTKAEVHHSVGRWCGSYITVFGTWCEPLSIEFINKLNARLAEVKAEHEAQANSACAQETRS
ncbi:MAG TPA: hypothetical protein VFE24_11735 [Pirellulales bacterium]|jgi:hypothetical protein|nr:hypothetical protein [Pirellulales bacterium]